MADVEMGFQSDVFSFLSVVGALGSHSGASEFSLGEYEGKTSVISLNKVWRLHGVPQGYVCGPISDQIFSPRRAGRLWGGQAQKLTTDQVSHYIGAPQCTSVSISELTRSPSGRPFSVWVLNSPLRAGVCKWLSAWVLCEKGKRKCVSYMEGV